VYAGLDQKFKESAHANVFIGTVEVDPTIHDLVKEVICHRSSLKPYVTNYSEKTKCKTLCRSLSLQSVFFPGKRLDSLSRKNLYLLTE
ncbi:hypothetical protein M2T59_30760, partial [Klebsiella pneumoniae]|nr:hypothetical protein [Klebsiella pneumoniae]